MVVARSLPQTPYTLELTLGAPALDRCPICSVMFRTHLMRRMCVVVRQVPYAFAPRSPMWKDASTDLG
jgi:hypothetical protein